MSKTLIVGGTKGIGLEIANLMADKECVIFSRSENSNDNSKHSHYQIDILNNKYLIFITILIYFFL